MSSQHLTTIKRVLREDILPGGKSDKKSPSDFDPHELRMGIEIEQEHTTNKTLAREIAMDHLSEDPHYYTHLKKMEKQHMKEDLG